jgi:hypothetical protein
LQGENEGRGSNESRPSIYREAAWKLGISIETVEKHKQALMERLNSHDIASLTRHAIAVGIVESSIQLTLV